jgi:uncharacterized membrane protein YraQ (UPF0718 family)
MSIRRPALDWSTAVLAVVVVAAGVTVYLRDGSAHFLAVLGHDFEIFLGMLGKVLAGCLIGSFITLLLPREVVARWVGAESGFTGIVIATIAGAILPGGPFTIYPIAGAFVVIGADIGAIAAFITGWSLLGYSRVVVWELPFFGPEFVGWRMLISIPLPIVAGLLARMVVRHFGISMPR